MGWGEMAELRVQLIMATNPALLLVPRHLTREVLVTRERCWSLERGAPWCLGRRRLFPKNTQMWGSQVNSFVPFGFPP